MAVSPKFYSRGIYMKKRQKCKALAVLLSVVLSAVVLMPAFQTGISAATYTQGFENNFNNCGAGFSIYNGAEGDKFVHSGTHSLKIEKVTGTKVTSLYQQGLQLEVGRDYIVTLWVYVNAEAGDYTSIRVQPIYDKVNGWGYDSTNRGQEHGISGNPAKWQEVRLVINAKYQYLGLSIWGRGEPDVYFDDIKVVEAPLPVTVTFNSNGGSSVVPISGVPGQALSLTEIPVKEGEFFGGWYTDSACATPFKGNAFPDVATTLYAKWNKASTYNQGFENYDLSFENNSGFSIYSGKTNDENVYSGTHSLYKDGSVTTATKVLTLSNQSTELTVGKGYRFSAKLKVTGIGSGTGLSFSQLSVRNNPWSYSECISLLYIGSDYKHLNQFAEIECYFIATQKYFGLTSWGGATYYLDDVGITEMPTVKVNFETPGITAPAVAEGPANLPLTVANPTPPAGKTFAGWYEDSTYQKPVDIKIYPQADTTYYAKWLDEGCFEQSFENWVGGSGIMSDTFSVYKAVTENDPNVYDGKSSIKYDSNKSGTYAISLFDDAMGELKIGEKYQVVVRFKPVRTPESSWSDVGSYHSIYFTNQWDNVWNFESQGPFGKYQAYAFYENNINDKWSGTTDAVTTTTEKDENGWLTMTYEITAPSKYLALYLAGDFAMYIDAVTIRPLPYGLVERNYQNAYCEPFYNQLKNVDFSNSAAGKKSIYKLEVGSRADLVFSADPKNGAKAYLAYDAAGNNIVEGTEFAEGSVHSASRIIADFTGIYYLVIEGNAKTDFNYLALFKQNFGLPEKQVPAELAEANFESLTVKGAEVDSPEFDVRFEENVEVTTAAVPIFNATPVQNNFLGFNGVYHGFAYQKDNWGRTLTNEMAELELSRAKSIGIKIARSYYDGGYAWDAKTKKFDWDSEGMRAFYKWSNKLQEGGVKTWISYWYENTYYLRTHHWVDKDKTGHENDVFVGFADPNKNQQKILENYAEFMADTVEQFHAHGAKNAAYISTATEPGAYWREEWGTTAERKEFVDNCANMQATAANTVHTALKNRGLRNTVQIIGPNFSGDDEICNEYLYYYQKHLLTGAVDMLSAHRYQGTDLTADNYSAWQDKIDTVKTVMDPKNWIYDEYGMSAGSQGTGYRKSSGLYGYQMALANMAFLNNGLKSSAIWTLFDQQWPNNSSNHESDSWSDGVHLWGCMPTLLRSSFVYPFYHYVNLAFNIMGQTGSKVYAGDKEALDGVYAAMTKGPDGSYNIMVINTNLDAANVTLQFETSLGDATLYRHVYDPNNVFATDDTKLTAPDKKIIHTNKVLKDQIIPYGVAFYTTRRVCK